jgi:hypothetical protein
MRLVPALARRIPRLLLLALAAPSVPAVPLQVYGQLPHLEEMAVSPDGSLIAFVKTEGNARIVSVVSLAKHGMVGGLRVGEAKLRRIEWADDHNLMVATSASALPWGFIGMQGSETRVQMLQAPVDFLRANNPPD